MMVVSPDVGSVSRARTFAQKLHMNLAIVDKRRQKANSCEVMNVIGDVRDKDCILFDDMVDTGRFPLQRRPHVCKRPSSVEHHCPPTGTQDFPGPLPASGRGGVPQ